ncbi:MAG: hypothetical protein JXR53_07620 [Bacteroidales bacterium]|nr:hypothetical protein [Bacteroidales bacterium]
MKKNILALFLIFLSIVAFGQKTKVKESIIKIGEGKNNALIVNINGANEDDVIKAWKDKMKATGAKVSGKKSMFADDATMMSISSNTMDIYSEISEKGEYIELAVGFDLGGAYLNSKEHATGYKAAEKMLYDFAVDQAKEAINKEISTQEGLIKDLEKDQSKLEKDNEKLASDIEDYKKRIEDAEKTIENNKTEIENKIKELETQNESLKSLEKKLNDVD